MSKRLLQILWQNVVAVQTVGGNSCIRGGPAKREINEVRLGYFLLTVSLSSVSRRRAQKTEGRNCQFLVNLVFPFLCVDNALLCRSNFQTVHEVMAGLRLTPLFLTHVPCHVFIQPLQRVVHASNEKRRIILSSQVRL